MSRHESWEHRTGRYVVNVVLAVGLLGFIVGCWVIASSFTEFTIGNL